MSQRDAYETIVVPYAAIPPIWLSVHEFIEAARPICERIDAKASAEHVQWMDNTAKEGLFGVMIYRQPRSRVSYSTWRWLEVAEQLNRIVPGTESIQFTAQQWLEVEQWRQRLPFEHLARDTAELAAAGYGSDWKAKP